MHLLTEALVIIKSAELMIQLLPPNETVTFTSVLQAGRSFFVVNDNLDERWIELTIGVVAFKIPSLRRRVGNFGIDRRNGILGSTDEGRAGVNGRVTTLP